MHASVLDWVPKVLAADEVTGKRVIEVGSYNVNGSARPYIESLGPASYTGTDMQPGPGVDMVCDAAVLPRQLGLPGADVIGCFEMLEHAPDWQAAMAGMLGVLLPGGLLVLTTRSEGFPYHPYPGDHWRFSAGAMGEIMWQAGMDVLDLPPGPDPMSPGVFLKARKPPSPPPPEASRRPLGAIPGVPAWTP